MSDSGSWMGQICTLINRRYGELTQFEWRVERKSKDLRRYGALLKASIILLGAVSATKATADAIIDTGTRQSLAIYTVLGVLTTIIAGLSTGFKPEEKGGQLAGLAAECASTRALIQFGWEKILIHHLGSLPLNPEKADVKQVEDLLQRFNIKMNDIYARAAALGVEVEVSNERMNLPGMEQLQSMGSVEGSGGPGRLMLDATLQSGPGQESKSRVEVAQYLWQEYTYRHDLIWRLLFRVTAVATTLSIAPFGIENLVARQVGLWIAFLPVLAVLMVVGSWPLFYTELHRFQEVKGFTRKAQNEVVGERVHDRRPDLFDWLIPLYLGILFILSLFVALLVWFDWYPSL